MCMYANLCSLDNIFFYIVYSIIITDIAYTNTIIPDTVDVKLHFLEIHILFVEFYTIPFIL